MKTLGRRQLLTGISIAAAALSVGGVGALAAGCDEIETNPDSDRQEALRQTVSVVLIPLFTDLAGSVDALAASADALGKSGDEATAAVARAALLSARTLWERSQVVAIGPSDDLALTGGAIDSWPADHAALDAVVASTTPIDQTTFETRPANQRGFPALEHLLFDSTVTAAVAVARLTTDADAPRRRAAISSAARDLAKKVHAVVDAWTFPSGYGRELAEAGAGSATFGSQKDAVDKLVTAMLALAELMVVAKLTKPLGLDTGAGPTPGYEQAPRSDFTLAALAANLDAIEAVYSCTYDGESGASLSGHVAEVSAAADAAFRKTLAEAKSALTAVPAPFRVQLTTDTAPLAALLTAVQAVKRGIATDVASPLGASIGFGYSDTD